MQVVLEKSRRLIWQNRSRNGGTKLLFRAKEIQLRKLLTHLVTHRGHSKAVFLVPMVSGMMFGFMLRVKFCDCAFFQELEPFQRQALA